jgi:hypothetical protein
MRFSIPPTGTPAISDDGRWVRAEGDPLPHPVTLRLEVGDDGRLLVTGLLIEAQHELTARDLRFPLAQIVEAFDAALRKPQTVSRLFRELTGSELLLEGDWPTELPAAWRDLLLPPPATDAPRRTRPGPHGHDESFYRELARDYRRAMREHPQRPIQVLIESRGFSEPAIHRQLKEARKRGLLPPRTAKASTKRPTKRRPRAGKGG